MTKVFLGGTCNSTWREELILSLRIDYFNPVVDNLTSKYQIEEIKQREECDFCLYVITPKMTGMYSIAEVVDDSNKRPDKTVFCVMDEDDGDVFEEYQIKSLYMIKKMIWQNGGNVCENLNEVANYLNGY